MLLATRKQVATITYSLRAKYMQIFSSLNSSLDAINARSLRMQQDLLVTHVRSAGRIKVESSDLTSVDISETLSRIAVVDHSSSIESHLILLVE